MSKTVLVVDDSVSSRAVVRLALQSAGYTVVEAADGEDACGKLDRQRLSLIVCDVHMPRMDGLSFVRLIKSQSAHQATPVIMLTAESQSAKLAEGRAAGAAAWITKPFQPSQLVAAANRLCP